MNTTGTNDPIDALIGGRVKAIREESGVARDALAEHVGVSAVMLGEMENGTKHITARHLLKLSEFFKVSPNYFFEGMLSFSADGSARAVSEEDIAYLIQNFLKVDAPDRGSLFKNFVAAVTKNPEKD